MVIRHLVLLALVVALFTLPNSAFSDDNIRLAPGDDKTNYASFDYKTDSLSLEQRKGKAADLLEIATTRQLGLPLAPIYENNLPDSRKIQLGRKLFFDRRLSRNKTMSCAMCHIPEQGFTNNELARPVGFEGRSLKRNAPTILNVTFYPKLFADAREFSLEQQVWSPLLAENEMNNPSIGYVINTIASAPDYKGMFELAFGSGPDMQTISMALAQYQRTLIAGDSRFDRWYFGQDKTALDEQELRGYSLFVGKAQCSTCHLIQSDYALFTDNKLHNTGIGYEDSMLKPSDTVSVQLAPGLKTNIARTQIDQVGGIKPNDLGRYEISLRPGDRWKFRTANLRNIELTAPYMHNGELNSLMDVISFYNQGGIQHDLLSPLIKPLNLNLDEQQSLVAFLKSLTSQRVKTLVADAFAVPIGDTNN